MNNGNGADVSDEYKKHHDESIKGDGTSHIQSLKVVLPESVQGHLRWINGMTIWLGISVALGIIAIMVCLWEGEQNARQAGIAEREARMAEYYGVDLEMYVAQHGLVPPPDPWGKSKQFGDRK